MSIKNRIKKYFPAVIILNRKFLILKKSTQYINTSYHLSQNNKYKLYKVYYSQSLLRRKLGNVDMSLQEAKIKNLILAVPKFDNIVIRLGQTFSFWKILGEPTYRRGYVDGMLLCEGKVVVGVGGGVCQLANMVHWLFLHTNMSVLEHWHHDYDIFPDSGRCIPFGSGVGVMYNYIDLQYRNITEETYTLSLDLTNTHLKGWVFSDTIQTNKIKVREEGHRFYKEDGITFRENKLYKDVVDKHTGGKISRTLIRHNKSKVLYEVEMPYNT